MEPVVGFGLKMSVLLIQNGRFYRAFKPALHLLDRTRGDSFGVRFGIRSGYW